VTTRTSGVVWEDHTDLVVIGGGVAGLTAARAASRRGMRVLTVSKGGPTDTSTQYAQGGIAVVAPQGDTVDAHVADTVAAGGGLCDGDAVRSIVSAGPDAVAALRDLGAVFDTGRDGDVARTREGGHSIRRIIHAGGDATGAEIQRALGAAGLPVLFGAAAARILTDDAGVTGVLVFDERGAGVVHAPAVLLATGGLGQLYACSTNPPGATADGIALAFAAGAGIADLEFVQFHPTVLFAAGGMGRRPLISEAVRGEGARLVDSRGESVTGGVHPLGDLAPRDVVSRAIARRLADLGEDHVFLDARHPAISRGGSRPSRPCAPTRDSILPTTCCRSPRPRTTRVAVSSPTSTGAPGFRGCTRPGKSPAPGCTGRTVSRPTACWKGWCSANAPASPPLWNAPVCGSKRPTRCRPSCPDSTGTSCNS